MHLGTFPTPVTPLPAAARAAGVRPDVALWCKRDDLTSPTYGGNKVRKLEHLLDEAVASGAKRIVTIGAIGSHHMRATALYGVRAGFIVEGVLAPQPWSPHVEEVARVQASVGLVPFPVPSFGAVALAVARRLVARGKTYLVPPGGSSITGSLGYVDAAGELADQIARGELPRPRTIVVALGSGGTAAGLLVGLARAGVLGRGEPPIELVAVQVVDPPLASATATLALSVGLARRISLRIDRPLLSAMNRALRVERGFLGEGYGHAIAAGSAAIAAAREDGLVLDPTYTAKAFAAALAIARDAAPGESVLYWHTLAAPGPFEALLAAAPPFDALPRSVQALAQGRPVSREHRVR
jgi:1-aminocyclopropane-1-carboxylate deaminase/D-cysteine desulfhydrase-like pyridoxal-dependent ACC family enzyme